MCKVLSCRGSLRPCGQCRDSGKPLEDIQRQPTNSSNPIVWSKRHRAAQFSKEPPINLLDIGGATPGFVPDPQPSIVLPGRNYRCLKFRDYQKYFSRLAKRLSLPPEDLMGQAYSAVDRYSFEERHKSLKLLQTTKETAVHPLDHGSPSSGSDDGDYLLGLVHSFISAINDKTWTLPAEYTDNVHPEFEVGCTFFGRYCSTYHDYLDCFHMVADQVPNLRVEVVFENAVVDELRGIGTCYVLTETTGTTHGWRDGTPVKTRSHAINVIEFVKEGERWLFRNQTWARGMMW